MVKAEDGARDAIASASAEVSKAMAKLDRALLSLPNKEPGLISMMYWVTHDPDYNLAFHTAESEWLVRFRIPAEVAEQVKAIGEIFRDPPARQLAKKLFKTHLVEPFLGIWTAEERSVGRRPSRYPKGLIPFMYWVKHNKAFNDAFHRDPQNVMSGFKLADGARDLIAQIDASPGSPSARTQAKRLFEEHLVGELLREEKPNFW
jgi:hypothetical protein